MDDLDLDLTLMQAIGLRQEMEKEDGFFVSSLEELGRQYLKRAFGREIDRELLGRMKDKCLSSSDEDVSLVSEAEFYEKVAMQQLLLDKAPREALLDLWSETNRDLVRIDENLKYVEDQIRDLESLSSSDSVRNYRLHHLQYYKARNKAAKDEVVHFITYKMKAKAASRASRFSGQAMFEKWLYGYSITNIFTAAPDSYDVRNFHTLTNKFGEFPLKTLPKLYELYDQDPVGFFDFARGYIRYGLADQNPGITSFPLKNIRSLIEKNHVINSRREILESLLERYLDGDYLSFVHMVPLQIEGIFHDICIALGIDEKKLNASSINEKLKILGGEIKHIYYVEYYAYEFPLIRNAIAHGKVLHGRNIEHEAILLMLDLVPVCELAASDEIPINKSVELLTTYFESGDYTNLRDWFSFRRLPIPGFYSVSSRVCEALLAFSDDGFWECIEQAFVDGDKDAVKKMVGEMSRENIARDKCQGFLRKVNSPK